MKGNAVRTSIDVELQAAAVTALAGRLGGIAVMRPGSGEVLALAGIAYSAPQPPGSVFKIITLAGALQAGTVKPSDSWPVQQAAVLEGVELENANGEFCGGNLRDSFAHSCNSVFAPIGAELGAEKLVAEAEKFGFNQKPSLAGAQMSTLPPAAEIGDDLAVGSTAIGQGRVLATPLEFATVAATIAEHGMRPQPTLRKGAPPVTEQVIPPDVARRVGSYMRTVVTSGTGTAANLTGVKVAGKTGTAELRDTTPEPDPITGELPISDASDTNAWFAAYAPIRRPKLAVAVMLVGAGAGGATAAPAARTRPRGRDLDVEVDHAVRLALGIHDPELERAVVERRGRHPEEQHAAPDRVVRRGGVEERVDRLGRDLRRRVVHEDVVVERDVERLEDRRPACPRSRTGWPARAAPPCRSRRA